MRFGRHVSSALWAWLLIPHAFGADLEMLDPGSLEAGPGESIVLQFHVPGFVPGTRVRTQGLHGRARTLPASQPDLLVIEYRMPRNSVPTEETLNISIPPLGIDETVQLDFDTAITSPMETLRFDPPWVESRPNQRLAGEVRADRGTGPAPSLRSSFGNLGEPTTDGDDWVWTWESDSAPDASAVVAFLLMDERNPDAPRAWGTLPIHVTKNLTMNAPVGYICELVQADQRSEGVAVTPAGTLAMDVAIDPTQTRATIDCTNPVGQVRRYPVELQLADLPRFVIGALPSRLPANPETPIPIHALFIQPDGRPARNIEAVVDTDSGTTEALESTGHPGVWRTRWQPDPSDGNIRVVMRQGGHDSEVRTQTVLVTHSLAIEISPTHLDPDSTSFTVTSSNQIPEGEPITALPRLVVRGARIINRPEVTESGARATYRLLRNEPGSWINASAAGPSLELAPIAVTAWAPSPHFLADATSERPVAIAVSDVFGQGVGGVEVRLSTHPATRGTLNAGTVETADDGVAWVWIRAGHEDGPLTLSAEVDGDIATATLHALPTDSTVCESARSRCEPLQFVVDGDPHSRRLEAAWQNRVHALWIEYRETPEELVPEDEPLTSSTVPRTVDDDGSEDSGTSGASGASGASGDTGAEIPPDAPSRPRLRAAFHLASLAHVYAATSELGAAAPERLEVQHGNFLEGNPLGSVSANAHLLLNLESVSLEAAWMTGRTKIGRLEGLEPVGFHHAWIGARRTQAFTGTWSGYASVGLDLQSFHLYTYQPSQPGEAFVNTVSVPGARLAMGLSWHNEGTALELELSEAFGPWPVRTTGVLRYTHPLTPQLYASGGLEMSFRTARFSAGNDEISLDDQFHALGLGLGVRLP